MNSHKSLKIISILLCISIVAVFVAYYFVYRDFKKKNENHHKIFYDLSFQSDRQNYLNSMRKAMNDNNLEIEILNNSIIPKEGEIGFIEDLETLARNNGLSIEIDSLVVDKNSRFASSTVDVLKVKAKTRGPWSGSYVFLSRLESLPFKIKIDKFGLTSALNDTSSTASKRLSGNIWQSTFEIQVLKYK